MSGFIFPFNKSNTSELCSFITSPLLSLSNNKCGVKLPKKPLGPHAPNPYFLRYLIKYGIKNMDRVIYDRVEDLVISHNDFIDMINKYEYSLGKDGLIDMLENSN